jgi:hypothetical protein
MRAVRSFGVVVDSSFYKKQATILELKMELKDLLIFAIMFVVAYVIYKILDKKMGP